MSGPSDRRGFLRGLASLPLIGGGVTILGNPIRAAEPMSDELFESYSEWLYYERKLLVEERWPGLKQQRFIPCNTGASHYHFPNYPGTWRELPAPSTRAAVVLAAVGCDWREEYR